MTEVTTLGTDLEMQTGASNLCTVICYTYCTFKLNEFEGNLQPSASSVNLRLVKSG